MRDYLTLGPTPVEEECAQLCEDNPGYREQALAECGRYKSQLERQFPNAEECDCEFKVKGFGHDFGRYYEVVVTFDTNNEKSVEFAFNVDENLPDNWVDEPQEEAPKA